MACTMLGIVPQAQSRPKPALAQVAMTSVFTPGARHAFVATADAVYGMARAYASCGESKGQVTSVFREMHSAEAWLEQARR